MNTKWEAACAFIENKPSEWHVFARPHSTDSKLFNGESVAVCKDEATAKKIAEAVNTVPELLAALQDVTSALEKHAFAISNKRGGVKKAFSDLNSAACARKVIYKYAAK